MMRLTAVFMTSVVIVPAMPAIAESDKFCERHEVLTVARAFVGEVENPFDAFKNLPMAVEDKGDHWFVYWVLPAEVIGGTPELHIDKRNCAILKVYHSQ